MDIQRSLHEQKIDCFAKILYTARKTEGIMNLIQSAGLGPLTCNSLMVAWPFTWVVNPKVRQRFIQTMQCCARVEH